jgi:hypothetical protein
VNKVNVNNLEQVLLVNMEKVKNKVLAVLAMFNMIREGDITPRLNRTHQEESEDGKRVKKVELEKETGDTFEECGGRGLRGEREPRERGSRDEQEQRSRELSGLEQHGREQHEREHEGGHAQEA